MTGPVPPHWTPFSADLDHAARLVLWYHDGDDLRRVDLGYAPDADLDLVPPELRAEARALVRSELDAEPPGDYRRQVEHDYDSTRFATRG